MLRPALVLLLFAVLFAQSGRAAAQQTLVLDGLSVSSEGSNLVARRGGQVLWRKPGFFTVRLTAGPGRFMTVHGFTFELDGEAADPKIRSLLILPASGKIVATVGGSLVSEGPDTAIFLAAPGIDPADSGSQMTVTRLSLTTLRPDVRQIGAHELLPQACWKKDDNDSDYESFKYGIPSDPKSEKHPTGVTIHYRNLRCDLTLKLTFATLKVELLSFKLAR